MLTDVPVGFTVRVKNLDNQLQEANNAISQDEKGCIHSLNSLGIFTHLLKNYIDSSELLSTVYEKRSVNEGSFLPHIWAYRSRITLEHLLHTLQTYNKKKDCPILHQFLTEVWSTHGTSSFL